MTETTMDALDALAKLNGASESPVRLVAAAEFVADFTAPDYLIDGIVQRSFLYALTAQMGHGKTSLGVLWARFVEHGVSFAGRACEKGRVCILAGENPDDLRGRLIVSSEAYGLPWTDRLVIAPGVFSIEGQFDNVAEQAQGLGGLDMVIVDTAAAYFPGEDENSNPQQGEFARMLRRLTQLAGNPGVVVNCHPPKAAGENNLVPRGGGHFLGEIDGNLTLWSSQRGSAVLHHSTKFRGPGFEPIQIKFETHYNDALVDRKGRRIPSVAAFAIDDREADEIAKAEQSDEDALLTAMLKHPGASFTTWCEHLGWKNDAGQPLKAKVHRTLQTFKGDKLAKKHRNKWLLTEAGKEEARTAANKV